MPSHHFLRAVVRQTEIINPAPTVQTSVSGATLTVNYPSGLIVGAQLIMFLDAQDPATTYVAITGWTKVADANGSAHYTRTVDGSEPSSITFTAIATGRCGTIIQIIGGTYDLVGADAATSGTPIAPSITATAPGILFGFFFNHGSGTAQTFTTPAGMTPLVSTSSATTSSFAIFTQSIASGATGTRTSTVSGNNANARLLAVKAN